MEMEITYFDKNAYITTETGNKVSRKSLVHGSQHIILGGRTILHPNTILRGDLAKIRIGRYCVINENTVLRPAFVQLHNYKLTRYFPFNCGDCVYIGSNSVVKACCIGSYIYIGDNVVIGQGAIIKDCCVIEDNTVLSAETICLPYRRYNKASSIVESLDDDVSECIRTSMVEFCRNYYDSFVEKQ